jgi:4-oxalocrotonate tautomerase
MPHVIVKMSPGRSEDQKRRLAEAFAKDLIEIVRCKESDRL